MYKNLDDFFRHVQNPLDSKDSISSLVDIYSSLHDFNGNFYAKLKKVNSVNDGFYNLDEKNDFFVSLFNCWKDIILHSSFSKDHRLDSFKKSLETFPNSNNIFEIKELLSNEEIKNYTNSFLNTDSSWVCMDSFQIHELDSFKQLLPYDVEHRLYINIDLCSIHKLGKLFFEQCEKSHLPYHFKFRQDDERNDSFVVYSDSNHLLTYYHLLEEIINKHPDLKEHIHRPPLLTGVVDEWIGYGSEFMIPSQSYNSIRAYIVQKVLQKEFKEIITEKPNLPLKINRKSTTLIDEITSRIISNKISMLTNINSIYFFDTYGIKPANLKKRTFLIPFYYKIKKTILNDLKKSNWDFSNLSYKSIKISDSEFYQSFFSTFPDILKNYPEVNSEIKNSIVKEAKTVGISDKNFCFNVFSTWNLSHEQSDNNSQKTYYLSK